MKENGRNVYKILNMKLKENDENLSLDEKRLIGLVRIVLRKNKIIIIDEFSSNEIFIQQTIDNIFKNATLITISDKIKDFNKYDKIMIFDNDNLIKFETPENLIKNENSMFKKLYGNNSI